MSPHFNVLGEICPSHETGYNFSSLVPQCGFSGKKGETAIRALSPALVRGGELAINVGEGRRT